MYTDGTSALKKEYSTRRKSSAKVQKITKLQTNKKNTVRMIKKRVVCAIALAFVMALTVLIRYAVIARDYGELTNSRKELELLNAKVVEAQMKAEGNLDPKKVDQEAQRLGLQQPDADQVKYISLGNTDNGEVLKTENANTFSAFINRVSVILEYLY